MCDMNNKINNFIPRMCKVGFSYRGMGMGKNISHRKCLLVFHLLHKKTRLVIWIRIKGLLIAQANQKDPRL